MPTRPFVLHPHVPTPQGRHSATFHPPPLDGTLAVPELFEYDAVHSPSHPLFVYPDPDASGGTRTICYPEALRLIHRTARIVHDYHSRAAPRYAAQVGVRPHDQPPTIGILAIADSVSFSSVLVATMWLGFTPFGISPRNSPAAVAHLLRATHVIQLIVSPDPAMQRLAAAAVALLAQDGVVVEILPMIQYDEISDAHAEKQKAGGGAEVYEVSDLKPAKLDLDKTAIMLHSSGSTSFPKPIRISHRTLLQYTSLPAFGEVDLCDTVLGIQPVPMFHGMGLPSITWSSSGGVVMGCYKPSSPPVLATPENYLEAVIASKSSVLFTVPSFVEAWLKNPSNLPAMKSLRAIVYSGAPMNKEIGDALVKMGVTLVPFYATTEIGCFSMAIPATVPAVDEWDYFQITGNLNAEMLPQDGMDDIFEATVIDSPYYNPNVLNAVTSDGRRMYRTSDLLQRHPRDPTRWRVFGRADDQLMLSTGEKTNPGPLEAILVQDPRIASALMFGRGQFQNGVLIEPKASFTFDPRDEEKLAEFRNAIWPTVERVNQFAPAHSRLFKEMIIVADPAKPFEYTPKGTPRRHVVIKAYDAEIKALYEAIADSSQTDIPAPETWTEDATLEFVRTIVEKVMKRQLANDDDIFQEGCDSLQATWIRNTILHALRQSTSLTLHNLPNNFVYSNPTISSLTLFVIKLFLQGAEERNDIADRVRAMDAMLAKHTSAFPVHTPRAGVRAPASTDEIVLLTGSTGRLGCHLLAQLLARSSVKRVYALNRGASEGDLKTRQANAFKIWGFDENIVTSKVTLLVADFAQPDLGLGKDAYTTIRDSVTSIIHNAWRVDFNLALSSFEPLVAGVRNIVDLSLGSPRPTPPAILFTSSISVVMSHTSSTVAETTLEDAKVAVGTGYGESKWVAENILLRARKEADVQTTVVRVGQLCGDSVSGGWNEKEWVPALLRGSQVLGAFPQRKEAISWVPVDVAAASLLDMLGSEEPVLHLVHPQPVSWNVISDAAAQTLGVPIVPYTEWAAKLREAARTSAADRNATKKNPALALLDFFVKDLGEDGTVALKTDRAVGVSPTLRSAERLESADVEKWIGSWRKSGFLQV